MAALCEWDGVVWHLSIHLWLYVGEGLAVTHEPHADAPGLVLLHDAGEQSIAIQPMRARRERPLQHYSVFWRAPCSAQRDTA